MGMSKVHKKLLQSNNYYLIINLDLTNEPDFFPVFSKSCILSKIQLQDINNEHTNIKKVNKFLDILPKRGARAFETFLDALSKSNQSYIKETLLICLNKSVPIFTEPLDMIDNVCDNRLDSRTNYMILIININKFQNDSLQREGSSQDVNSLHNFFVELLGYKLFKDKCHDDLTSSQIIDIVTDFSDHISQFSKGQIIIILMSHGKNSMISGSDEELVEIQNIIRILSRNTDIFRLFIFSCCRGEVAALAESTGDNQINSMTDSLSTKDLINSNSYENFGRRIGVAPLNSAVLYSTQQHYQSHREKTGTIFIQSMLSIFKNHYKHKTIRDMVITIKPEMEKLYPRYDQYPDIKENYFANCYL